MHSPPHVRTQRQFRGTITGAHHTEASIQPILQISLQAPADFGIPLVSVMTAIKRQHLICLVFPGLGGMNCFLNTFYEIL